MLIISYSLTNYQVGSVGPYMGSASNLKRLVGFEPCWYVGSVNEIQGEDGLLTGFKISRTSAHLLQICQSY